jgi:two-component system, OmpR family, phosphate regulon response regulator PhoB
MSVDGKNVLIIEDEREYAEMIKLRMELSGFDCALAGTTQEGVSEIRSKSYDLIVLDLMLPGGGGFVFLKEMRKDASKSGIPVMILTGKSLTPDVKIMIGTYNISAVFAKPYNPEEFLLAAESLVQS